MDIYGPKGNTGALALEHTRGLAIPTTDKPLGLGEVGTMPDVEAAVEQAPWLWFMLWGGFTHDEQANSIESLKRNFGSPYAVCLNELQQHGFVNIK